MEQNHQQQHHHDLEEELVVLPTEDQYDKVTEEQSSCPNCVRKESARSNTSERLYAKRRAPLVRSATLKVQKTQPEPPVLQRVASSGIVERIEDELNRTRRELDLIKREQAILVRENDLLEKLEALSGASVSHERMRRLSTLTVQNNTLANYETPAHWASIYNRHHSIYQPGPMLPPPPPEKPEMIKNSGRPGLVIAFSILLLALGFAIAFGFSALINAVIDSRVPLVKGADSYRWWSNPPVEPVIRVFVYNVTNADEFLNNGTKPELQELGPFVYVEKWEKVDIVDNKNGTLSFNYKRTYIYNTEMSNGTEDDLVIVPNVPMLSATSQSKHAARFLRLAMASIMDILKIKPFVEVTVGQLLWGYEDPLLKLAKDVVPKEQKLPYDEFGLMYGKNSTWKPRFTVFTGADDVGKFGIIERFNGKQMQTHWTTDNCNRINGSDGSIFPPHITQSTILEVFEKDMCRILPLRFDKQVVTAGNITGYRFTPDEMAFASVEKNPDNMCYCPGGPPCAPHGTFNVSLCQFDSPVLLSFPHFYLGDDSLRTAVNGISPPEKEKHALFIDVQPDMGTALRARARIQINLAVSQVVDIKQVATFPDIVFPILWFEEGIDELPEEITQLMALATQTAPKAREIMLYVFFIIGALLLITSIYCLIRNSHRQSTLHLESSNYLATASVDAAKKNAKK